MTEFGYDPSRIGTSETAAQLLARVNRINFGDLGLHTTRPLHSGDLLALSAEDTRNQPWIFKLALSILCEHLMPTSCGGRESSAHLIICAHTFPAFEFSDLLLAAIHEGAAEYGAPSDAATVLGWHRAAMNRIVVTHCLSLTEVLALARQISARDTSLVLLLGLDAISASHKTVRRHVAAVTALHQLHRSVARTGGLLAFAAHRELLRSLIRLTLV
ncbi:uncharacterized protein MONBRDRAFT_38779, partial [Monosiga brevicollis MX1]